MAKSEHYTTILKKCPYRIFYDTFTVLYCNIKHHERILLKVFGGWDVTLGAIS